MDMILTIILVIAFVLIEYSKIKKKLAAESQKRQVVEHEFLADEDMPEVENYEEEILRKNEKFESNSSKSQSYFTYETVSEPETPTETSAPFSSQKPDQNRIQEVENETETDNLNLHDPEELKKAVIYGEILKNPYN